MWRLRVWALDRGIVHIGYLVLIYSVNATSLVKAIRVL